jgi:hypothetical protein
MLAMENWYVLRFLDVSHKLEKAFFVTDIFARRRPFGKFRFGHDESHSLLSQSVADEILTPDAKSLAF